MSQEASGVSAMVRLAGEDVEVIDSQAVVAGTGAAGLCAADQLARLGVRDLTVIADKVQAGTSRNAGSDKQTYYKLTLAGVGQDSVREMAETLFAGGAMDGDTALVEAAWSARAFFHLVEAGVPFPYNGYGEFVGYKTDHDPRQRATSVGPYTSKSMVEHLQAQVEAAGVPIRDGYRIVDLIVVRGRVAGLLCWQTRQTRFVLFRCDYLVYATGGPAAIYADAVYPHGQWGAQSAGLRAGAAGKNLTEWQFGLASVKPRWNVSGSYMQVVPRFVSTDADGGDEREFLADAIADPGQLASLVFLKGYQWPFDARKAAGSSLIDLLVYQETVLRSRLVYLDFRTNPAGYDPAKLSREAGDYLAAAGVLGLATPIQRLRALNEPAYQFYREHNPGLDLERDRLQIGVCAQHNNGGLAVDAWWQSNVAGLFPVGEAAGAHGVYRPGGAALNSGQVGAMRAAAYIARDRGDGDWRTSSADFLQAAEPVVAHARALLEASTASYRATGYDETGERLAQAARLMSDRAGLVRAPAGVRDGLAQVAEALAAFEESGVAANPASRRSLDRVFLLRDVLATQYVYLSAMADYVAHGGASRGSVVYTDVAGGLPGVPGGGAALPECFRFSLDDGRLDAVVQEVRWDGRTAPVFDWRDRRPLPEPDDVFESVWKSYRNSENVA